MLKVKHEKDPVCALCKCGFSVFNGDTNEEGDPFYVVLEGKKDLKFHESCLAQRDLLVQTSASSLFSSFGQQMSSSESKGSVVVSNLSTDSFVQDLRSLFAGDKHLVEFVRSFALEGDQVRFEVVSKSCFAIIATGWKGWTNCLDDCSLLEFPKHWWFTSVNVFRYTDKQYRIIGKQLSGLVYTPDRHYSIKAFNDGTDFVCVVLIPTSKNPMKVDLLNDTFQEGVYTTAKKLALMTIEPLINRQLSELEKKQQMHNYIDHVCTFTLASFDKKRNMVLVGLTSESAGCIIDSNYSAIRRTESFKGSIQQSVLSYN